MSARIVTTRCFKAIHALQTVVKSQYSAIYSRYTSPFNQETPLESIYRASDITILARNPFSTSQASMETQKRKYDKRRRTKKLKRNEDPEEEVIDVEDLIATPAEEKAMIFDLVSKRLTANAKTAFSKLTFSRQQPLMQTLVRILQEEKFSNEDIVKLAGTSEVLEASGSDFLPFIRKLKLEGFTCPQISEILQYNPHVTKVGYQELDAVFNTLRGFSCSNNVMREAVVGNPVILQTAPKKLVSRYQMLIKLFIKKEILELLCRTPYILTCPWEDIEDKYLYVTDVMGLEEKNTVRSNLLAHSIQHIRTRHIFLERAGLYERPNKHGSTSIRNPSLKQIMDLDDINFSHTIAGMSLDEYKTFWKMYKLEMEEEEENEENIFSDEES